MRSLIVVTLIWLWTAATSAQTREVRVRGARITARDTTCWETSQAPCEGVGHEELDIVTGARHIVVRVVRVEVEVGDTWQPADDIHVSRRLDMVRTEPPHRTEPVIRVARRTTDVLFINHAIVRAGIDARVRVTLEIDGRRVTLEAAQHGITEAPDPEL